MDPVEQKLLEKDEFEYQDRSRIKTNFAVFDASELSRIVKFHGCYIALLFTSRNLLLEQVEAIVVARYDVEF